MISAMVAALFLTLAPAHPSQIIPIELHAGATAGEWQTSLEQYAPMAPLSTFNILIDLPETDSTTYLLLLKRKRAILQSREIPAGSSMTKPISLNIHPLLTAFNNDITLTIRAQDADTAPPSQLPSPSALLISQTDGLFTDKDLSPEATPTPPTSRLPARNHLGALSTIIVLFMIPLAYILLIKMRFFGHKHVRPAKK